MNQGDHPHSIDTGTACEAIAIVMGIIVISMFLAPNGNLTKLHLAQSAIAAERLQTSPRTCVIMRLPGPSLYDY
jgi:hypothetical protein